MAQSDEEIKLKDCPQCRTPIAKTQRFMNIVKKVYHDVQLVKRRVFGDTKRIEASRDDLREKLLILMSLHMRFMTGTFYYLLLFSRVRLIDICYRYYEAKSFCHRALVFFHFG
jgi:hypothetical protein